MPHARMHPLFVRLIMLCVVWALSACVTTPEMHGRSPSPGDGKAVISIGIPAEGERDFDYSGYGLSWRSVATRIDGEVSYAPKSLFLPDSTYKLSDSDGTGVVHVLSLPPGEYEIFNFALQTARAGSITTFRAKVPFSLPFRVEAGKVTYVGRFVAQAFKRRNPLGFQTGAGGFYYWLMREQVDLAVVQQQVPSFGALPRAASPNGGDAPPYIKYLGTSALNR